MNAVIKSHQEMYDRFQLAICSNEILTKEVNHGRSGYLVGIQAFKKSHDNLHKLISHTDQKETTLMSKIRERNRDLVHRIKCLEKANSALSSRLRLEDMDPEALVLMVEGEFSPFIIDWETLTPDSQTRRALKAVYKIGLEDGRDHDTLTDDIARTKVWFAEIRAEKQDKAEESAAAGLSAPSPLTVSVLVGGNFYAFADSFTFDHADWTSTVSGGKKGKGKTQRRRTGSDDEDVDFGGGGSIEDALEEGRECSATPSSATTSQPQPKKQKTSPPASPPTQAEKSQPSPKSSSKSSSSKPSSSKPSVPAPAHHKAGSAPKKVDVTVSDTESMSSPRRTSKRKAAMSSVFRSSFHLAGGSRSDIKSLTSKSSPGQSVKSSPKSKKSQPKKTKSGRSSSDESVISVSSESESESSSDQDSWASEGCEAHEDDESELSKFRPASHGDFYETQIQDQACFSGQG
ncbi:hypothetical protein PHMEG_00030027 [Phytophthora megakarya]|uniref:Uncharacterized protein n=1 Tax=Phytophthora megakarya TaxID=4795 RepID=A0A225UZT7_9STRA|nr:hypothetical protein PHMEG_00030027 [Phytophthora megakarya]